MTDPVGRGVVFDAGSPLRPARRVRTELLDYVDAILGAVETPDLREDDPVPGRERFYRMKFIEVDRWLRVDIDFNDVPAWIATAFCPLTMSRNATPRLKPR
jgi:hypothetical protein